MNTGHGFLNGFWSCIMLSWGVQLGDQVLWEWIHRFNDEAYSDIVSVEHGTVMGFGAIYPTVSIFRNILPEIAILLLIAAAVCYFVVVWRSRRSHDYVFIVLGLISLILSYLSAGRVIMHA